MNDKNFQDKINILMQNLSKGDFDQAEKDGLKLDVSLKNNHIVKGALGVIFLSKKKFDKNGWEWMMFIWKTKRFIKYRQ